ncbi:MAG TPA: metal-dependent hydrolase [Thermoanaerobaculia bacterium]|nr:metal-dependent hydrolase [Thermoanaerobaculia bacterium]
MPTIFSHPAVPLALRRVVGPLPRGVVIAGVIGAIAPDLDVIAFAFHVPYGSMFGHRGFTHSIVFALLFAALFARTRGAFAYVFTAVVSHPILDAMTNGGRGVAFFSPFSNRRFFFPWRPIEVSPIGAIDFSVLLSELWWVWLPCGVVAVIATVTRRWRGARARDRGRSGM